MDLFYEISDKYPRSLEEDIEILNTRTDISQNVRNALQVTIEEKTVLQEMFMALDYASKLLYQDIERVDLDSNGFDFDPAIVDYLK